MSTTPHPRAQLSAYLDGALPSSERAAVDTHLAGCAECRTRLGQLGATARLIAALPDPRPTRRLVPRVAGPPAWLAPLRTLTTIASGVSVFLFIATALMANIGQLASTGAALNAPAAAPAASAGPFGAAAPTQQFAPANPTSGPAGPAGAGASLPSVPPLSTTQRSSAQDAVKSGSSASPSPNTPLAETGTSAPQDAAARNAHAAEPARGTPALGVPWTWLGIAIISGALAIVLQRRLSAAAR